MASAADKKLAKKVGDRVAEDIRDLDWTHDGGYLKPIQEAILEGAADVLRKATLEVLSELTVEQNRKDRDEITTLRAQNRDLKRRVAEYEAIDKMLTEARAAS